MQIRALPPRKKPSAVALLPRSRVLGYYLACTLLLAAPAAVAACTHVIVSAGQSNAVGRDSRPYAVGAHTAAERTEAVVDAHGNAVELFAPSANDPFGPKYRPASTFAYNVQALGGLASVDVDYVGTVNVFETRERTNASGWFPVGPGGTGLRLVPFSNLTAPVYDFLNDDNTAGVSFVYDFARWYAATALPAGCRLVVLPAAAGTTSIRGQWSPSPPHGLFVRLTNAMRTLAARGDTTFAAVLWHQGENDAPAWRAYGNSLRALIAGVRDAVGDAGLPFIAGGLAHTWGARYSGASGITATVDALPTDVPCTAAVSSLGLDGWNDGVHFTAYSHRLFALRYQVAYCDVIARDAQCRGAARACPAPPSPLEPPSLPAPTIVSFGGGTLNFTSAATSAYSARNAAVYVLWVAGATAANGSDVTPRAPLLLSEHFVAPHPEWIRGNITRVPLALFVPYLGAMNYARLSGFTLPGFDGVAFAGALPAVQALPPPRTPVAALQSTMPILGVALGAHVVSLDATLAAASFDSATQAFTVGPSTCVRLPSMAACEAASWSGTAAATPSAAASPSADGSPTATATGVPSVTPPATATPSASGSAAATAAGTVSPSSLALAGSITATGVPTGTPSVSTSPPAQVASLTPSLSPSATATEGAIVAPTREAPPNATGSATAASSTETCSTPASPAPSSPRPAPLTDAIHVAGGWVRAHSLGGIDGGGHAAASGPRAPWALVGWAASVALGGLAGALAVDLWRRRPR